MADIFYFAIGSILLGGFGLVAIGIWGLKTSAGIASVPPTKTLTPASSPPTLSERLALQREEYDAGDPVVPAALTSSASVAASILSKHGKRKFKSRQIELHKQLAQEVWGIQ